MPVMWAMKNCKFASIFMLVWSLISQIKGRIQIEGAWEQGTEENIWI
jgi:hypothetical protein